MVIDSLFRLDALVSLLDVDDPSLLLGRSLQVYLCLHDFVMLQYVIPVTYSVMNRTSSRFKKLICVVIVQISVKVHFCPKVSF